MRHCPVAGDPPWLIAHPYPTIGQLEFFQATYLRTIETRLKASSVKFETGEYGHFPSWAHPKENASLSQISLEELLLHKSTLVISHLLLSHVLESLEQPNCLFPHWIEE